MSDSLTYNDLPAEIEQWPVFPLSLDGTRVTSVDYLVADISWLLYGRGLDKDRLNAFVHQLGIPLVVIKAWRVEGYQVVQLAGTIPEGAGKVADDMQLDVALISELPKLTVPGLLVMDMDSTAIQIECIDELAKLAGAGEQVIEITERAMRGELDFVTSLRERVATLAGAEITILDKVLQKLPLTPGLTMLVEQLQGRGWHVALVSGGFSYFADHLCERLSLTAVFANTLEIEQGKLTGNVIGPIVDAKMKADALISLAQELNIPINQTVAIGDGANDLKMIHMAGLGIAYHAKPKVDAEAKFAIRHADLIGVLCILSANE